jgi:hypothetical protein
MYGAGRLLAAASVLSGAMLSSAYGVVRHVDANAPVGVNDGVTWGTAFNFLKDGIAVALPDDEIWVAQGTYRPDQSESDPGGSDLRGDTFNLLKNLKIFGGFPTGGGAGGGDNFAARDPELYTTILSGNIGDPLLSTDNSDHIVTAEEVDKTAVLNGFTISNGHADFGGGGILILSVGMGNTGPVVVRCKLIDNEAGGRGGGVYLFGASADPTCSAAL